MNKPKVIIFDFDRTLTYLYKDKTLLTDLATKICGYYSKYIDIQDDFYAMDGYHSWHNLHRLICKKYNYEESSNINNNAEKIVTDFEFKVMSKTNLLDGVVDTIQQLYTNGYQLMVVSSNSVKVIEYAFKKNNIISYFTHIFGRPNPFNPDLIKPNAFPIQQAISKTNVPISEIWYIGDDIVDIDSANSCGVVSVGVASGKYSCKDLKQRGAEIVLKNIGDILSLINNCN